MAAYRRTRTRNIADAPWAGRITCVTGKCFHLLVTQQIGGVEARIFLRPEPCEDAIEPQGAIFTSVSVPMRIGTYLK